MPGWDSCDESQSPPIENDEWLAFLNRSIQELLDGEFDSLKQHNLVSIIVAPLRNSKAIPKVLLSVAQLLSLPFVLADQHLVAEAIKGVYIDVKLVPNLMYACKLLLSQRQLTDSAASLPGATGVSLSRTLRSVSDLTAEEMNTACSLYELVCHLVHLQQQFLSQFCDAVAILAVNDMFISFLTHGKPVAGVDDSDPILTIPLSLQISKTAARYVWPAACWPCSVAFCASCPRTPSWSRRLYSIRACSWCRSCRVSISCCGSAPARCCCSWHASVCAACSAFGVAS